MTFFGPPRDGSPAENPPDAAHRSGWGVPVTVALVIAVVVGLSLMLHQDKREVTNAPGGTPPSVQQPDTTPPANQAPAK